MRWIRALLGDDDGPPKVSLSSPRREPKPDPALAIPPDPRPVRTRAEAARWRCPALHGEGKGKRACGLPKTPEKATCGRPGCKAWATRQAKEEGPKADVVDLPARRRARG